MNNSQNLMHIFGQNKQKFCFNESFIKLQKFPIYSLNCHESYILNHTTVIDPTTLLSVVPKGTIIDNRNLPILPFLNPSLSTFCIGIFQNISYYQNIAGCSCNAEQLFRKWTKQSK